MKIKNRFTNYYLYLLLFFSSTSLLAQNQSTIIDNAYPQGVSKEIYYGMPLSEFEQNIEGAELVEENSFRIVFIQKLTTKEIQKIVYYFDLDGEKPLYEIIITYSNLQQPVNIAHSLFGEPNFDQTEWRVHTNEHKIWSWVFKEKLVIVANIPDTEWSSKWNN
ncbi:hypothetical protein ATE92_2068 [Ulvibacter sp. MAR_2010_11]|uniref:hypothetical protein n=1 Tax=Ulvibacter sp. MAR_2010_11 TaxID=1250229 RepID=UPI000C2C3107|nr:hypothetical protein [Ulvibacter sp. MAR_2010_11]PKA83899.1 hypothetical protein ATE92_2068 [Ulvibacter sp. MAR_2010_11]